MFAFKVLNLKTCSEKLISILLTLSGGLISMIFASPMASNLPIPHIPVPVLIFMLSFNYALYGATFLTLNKKEAPSQTVFLALSYIAMLMLPLLLLRYERYFISLFMSLFSVFILIFILKKHHFSKKTFLLFIIHIITSLYLFYLSFSFIF